MAYFYSVEKERCQEIKIKRSTFICTLAPAASMEEAKTVISRVSAAHKTATHNCWAYVVGEKGEMFHASDNGEPSGTAGQPMLHVLQRHRMTWVAAVVTRYFGGVKLGIRGLIEAYGQAVEEAVDLAPLKKLVNTVTYQVTVPYAFNDTLLYQLNQYQGEIVHTDYTDSVMHQVAVEVHRAPELEKTAHRIPGGRETALYPLR